MKISVIIPCYNSAGSIERCLDSVRKQTFVCDYEIIVINDGSQDKTKEVLNNYVTMHPECCIKIIDQSNAGVSSARNAGMQVSTGDYIALLDSDDEWLSHKTELQITAMIRNPSIDYIGSNTLNGMVAILWKRKVVLSQIKIWELFIRWHPQTSTVLFKRNILIDVGYYNQQMTHGEDGEYLLRICSQKNCWFMPEQLVQFGQGKPGFGHSGLSANLEAMQHGQIQILDFAYKQGIIHWWQFGVFKLYAIVKFWRRIILSKIR